MPTDLKALTTDELHDLRKEVDRELSARSSKEVLKRLDEDGPKLLALIGDARKTVSSAAGLLLDPDGKHGLREQVENGMAGLESNVKGAMDRWRESLKKKAEEQAGRGG